MVTKYRPTVGQHFEDASRLSVGHMSVVYWSTVGDILVSCQSNISHVSSIATLYIG